MQHEPALMELRRKVTDQMVRMLHWCSGQRTASALGAIRTYGIEEKTAAEVADRLVEAGELVRVEVEAGAYYQLTAKGREVARATYNRTAAA